MASSGSSNPDAQDEEELPDAETVDWGDAPLPDAEGLQWGPAHEGATSAPAAPVEVPTAPQTPQEPALTAPPPDPGFLRTVGSGLLHGFFKSGSDEAAGAIAAAGTNLMPGARYRQPDGTTRKLESSGDLYRAVRDTERQIDAGGREHRPVVSFLSNMAGDIASDAALGALGVPVASTGYQAASGALSGLLGSDAELTGQGGGAMSALGSTALGGALGALAPKVGAAVAQSLPGGMARFRAWLEEQAIDKARKVLTNGADQLSTRRPVADSAVREALDSGAIDVWGTTKGAFQALEELAETRGANYGGIIDRLQEAGVQGPRTEGIASELLAASLDSADNSGANKAVANAFSAEADNVRSVAPPNFSLLGEYTTPPVNLSAPAPATRYTARDARGRWIPMAKRLEVIPDAPPPASFEREFIPYGNPVAGPPQPRLELEQAERIKRVLQNEAKYGRIDETPLNEAKRDIASVYRRHIEDAVEEAGMAAPRGSDVAELAEEFRPVKQQLGNTLEARDAAMRGAARAAQRVGGASGVSLFDLANATQATGVTGWPSMALAGASRIWRERGPSTLANMYDVGAEAAGNFGHWAAANPELAEAGATLGAGAIGRQITSGLANGGPRPPNGGEGAQNLHQALARNPEVFGAYAARLQEAALQGPDSFAMQDYLMAQTDPDYAERRRRALGAEN